MLRAATVPEWSALVRELTVRSEGRDTVELQADLAAALRALVFIWRDLWESMWDSAGHCVDAEQVAGAAERCRQALAPYFRDALPEWLREEWADGAQA